MDAVIRNIEKGDTEPRDNVDPSNYLINNFNGIFSIINWEYVINYEIYKIIKSLKSKNSYGYDEVPIKILKF